jgi:hypothetical protein
MELHGPQSRASVHRAEGDAVEGLGQDEFRRGNGIIAVHEIEFGPGLDAGEDLAVPDPRQVIPAMCGTRMGRPSSSVRDRLNMAHSPEMIPRALVSFSAL